MNYILFPMHIPWSILFFPPSKVIIYLCLIKMLSTYFGFSTIQEQVRADVLGSIESIISEKIIINYPKNYPNWDKYTKAMAKYGTDSVSDDFFPRFPSCVGSLIPSSSFRL